MKDINFNPGAIKDVYDPRDYQFSDAIVALALAPFNWDIKYDIEKIIGRKLPVKDQERSGSCGGQAWSYYGQALDPDHDEKSAKFIYAHTFIPPAGSAGRDNCKFVKEKGWGLETLTPSHPATEEFMQRRSDITDQAYEQALTDKALFYSNIEINIESIAKAIVNNRGCIIGITGKNNGTWLSKFPIKPDKIDNTGWNHWVYCGKLEVINGKKYIGFINSWGKDCGEEGWQYISEEYLQYPYVWSAWTLSYDFPKPDYVFKLFMHFGSSGPQVKQLQMRLNKELPTKIKVDGFFGRQTKHAVIDFQILHGLKGDGLVGPLTNAKLNEKI